MLQDLHYWILCLCIQEPPRQVNGWCVVTWVSGSFDCQVCDFKGEVPIDLYTHLATAHRFKKVRQFMKRSQYLLSFSTLSSFTSSWYAANATSPARSRKRWPTTTPPPRTGLPRTRMPFTRVTYSQTSLANCATTRQSALPASRGTRRPGTRTRTSCAPCVISGKVRHQGRPRDNDEPERAVSQLFQICPALERQTTHHPGAREAEALRLSQVRPPLRIEGKPQRPPKNVPPEGYKGQRLWPIQREESAATGNLCLQFVQLYHWGRGELVQPHQGKSSFCHRRPETCVDAGPAGERRSAAKRSHAGRGRI